MNTKWVVRWRERNRRADAIRWSLVAIRNEGYFSRVLFTTRVILLKVISSVFLCAGRFIVVLEIFVISTFQVFGCIILPLSIVYLVVILFFGVSDFIPSCYVFFCFRGTNIHFFEEILRRNIWWVIFELYFPIQFSFGFIFKPLFW